MTMCELVFYLRLLLTLVLKTTVFFFVLQFCVPISCYSVLCRILEIAAMHCIMKSLCVLCFNSKGGG